MNAEQMEYELTLIKGKEVYLIIPVSIGASLSVAGKLEVVETKEHSVGFHVCSLAMAVIFFADDIESVEPALTQSFTKTIRLKKSALKA